MASLVSLFATVARAETQTVGTVSAANPMAYGTAPGAKSHVLAVGANVVFKEQITTSSAGSAQLTFLDRSTINVGPDSTVVIDDFVYRPETSTGEMGVKITKGLMRFVGGEISHAGGMSVTTPTVTVGIRGGVATVGYVLDPRDDDGTETTSRRPGTIVINHFGEMVVRTASSEVRLTRPGFAVFVGAASGTIGAPFRMPPAATQKLASKMSSRPGQHGGAKLVGGPIGGGLPASTFRMPQPPPLSGLTLSGMIAGANNLVRNRTQGQRANQLNQDLNAHMPAIGAMAVPATTPAPGTTIASSPPAQTSVPSQGQTSQGTPATSSQTGGASSPPTGASSPASSPSGGTSSPPAGASSPASSPSGGASSAPPGPSSGNSGNGTPSGQPPATSIPSGQSSGGQTTVPPGAANGQSQGDGPPGHDNGRGNDGQNNGHGNE